MGGRWLPDPLVMQDLGSQADLISNSSGVGLSPRKGHADFASWGLSWRREPAFLGSDWTVDSGPASTRVQSGVSPSHWVSMDSNTLRFHSSQEIPLAKLSFLQLIRILPLAYCSGHRCGISLRWDSTHPLYVHQHFFLVLEHLSQCLHSPFM